MCVTGESAVSLSAITPTISNMRYRLKTLVRLKSTEYALSLKVDSTEYQHALSAALHMGALHMSL